MASRRHTQIDPSWESVMSCFPLSFIVDKFFNAKVVALDAQVGGLNDCFLVYNKFHSKVSAALADDAQLIANYQTISTVLQKCKVFTSCISAVNMCHCDFAPLSKTSRIQENIKYNVLQLNTNPSLHMLS